MTQHQCISNPHITCDCKPGECSVDWRWGAQWAPEQIASSKPSKPLTFNHIVAPRSIFDIAIAARNEFEAEQFREAVEREKERLRARRDGSLWARIKRAFASKWARRFQDQSVPSNPYFRSPL
jgi:hypothetical protein